MGQLLYDLGVSENRGCPQNWQFYSLTCKLVHDSIIRQVVMRTNVLPPRPS